MLCSVCSKLLVFSLLLKQLCISLFLEQNLHSSRRRKINSYWLSSFGQFAFGFYKKENGFAIGIWFEKILQKTVIWTGNRDDPPLPKGVTLLLTNNGRLVLQSKDGQQTSLVNAPVPASSASMLNTGNFVLYSSDSRIIWQSFGVPTDTILPGQRLFPGNQLVSSTSGTNHASGSFQLAMQKDGNLVQYPVNGPIAPEYSYWNSGTFTGGDNVTLNLDGNGQLYLLNTTGFSIRKFTTAQSDSSDIAFYRLTIAFDGILRLYSHSSNQSDDWLTEWSSSSNKCDPIGLCGVNSCCTLMDQEPNCVCSPGFDFLDQKMKNLGCKRNFITDGCMNKNGESFELQELEAISWEDNPYSTFPSTKADCRDDCLRDCNLFRGQQCSKQKLPLRFGRIRIGSTTATFVKAGIDSGRNATMVPKEIKKILRRDILIIGVACLAFALIFLAFFAILIFRYRIWTYKRLSREAANEGILIEDFSMRAFTYSELEVATNGFVEQLGRGSFGTVFKGTLSNGQRTIAVKRLEKVVAEGEGEEEFRNEMRSIGRTHHKNLVRLLGYCHDGSNQLLVYEYMSNGTLADYLFKSQVKPNWEERIKIALNIARGILYLHLECVTQIIHCDINPNNILMDEHGRAKIADFGLAKLWMPDHSKTHTGVSGTRGYVAPEWLKNLPITVKADVYSFAIVFLVIICCRRSIDINAPQDEVVLVDWAYDCFKSNEVRKLVPEEADAESLEMMLRIGLWCIEEETSARPSMKKVIQMLQGTVEIPIPPCARSSLQT